MPEFNEVPQGYTVSASAREAFGSRFNEVIAILKKLDQNLAHAEDSAPHWGEDLNESGAQAIRNRVSREIEEVAERLKTRLSGIDPDLAETIRWKQGNAIEFLKQQLQNDLESFIIIAVSSPDTVAKRLADRFSGEERKETIAAIIKGR